MITLLLAATLLAEAFDQAPCLKGHRPRGPAAGGDAAVGRRRGGRGIRRYRCMPELGHITISDGIVPQPPSPCSTSNRTPRRLATRGIFPCTDEKRRRSYRRTDEMAGHKFETLVMIIPPADEEDDWTHPRHRARRRPQEAGLLESAIRPTGRSWFTASRIFPEDGTIEVAAVDADGEEIFHPGAERRSTTPASSPTTHLQPDEGDDEEMSKPLEEEGVNAATARAGGDGGPGCPRQPLRQPGPSSPDAVGPFLVERQGRELRAARPDQ